MNTDEQDRNRLRQTQRRESFTRCEMIFYVILAAILLALLFIVAIDDAGAAPPSPRPCPVGWVAKPCPPAWGPACARCERIYVPGLPRR